MKGISDAGILAMRVFFGEIVFKIVVVREGGGAKEGVGRRHS